MDYLFLVIVTLLIGIGSSAYVKHELKKNSSRYVSNGLTGAEAAERMLQHYGIHNVKIYRGGYGQDYYDPKTNSITLSPESYGVSTITATATACHEAGHACQYAENYTPMKIRGSIVPVANFASNAWVFILLAGIFFQITGLIDLAILTYLAVVVFELVTLPVEFNASKRAREYMAICGIPAVEQKHASSVLTSCAMTYVAAALSSILQLLWLLGQREE